MTADTDEIDRIERELAATRARLDATIDGLQQKLSPGELMSQAVTYFKEGSGMDLSHDIGRSLRDNSMPLALIGIGLGWLVLSGKRQPNAAFSTAPGYPSPRERWPDEGMPIDPIMPAYQAAAYDDLATKAMEAGAGVSRQDDESDQSFHERISAAKAAVLGLTRDAGEAASTFGQRIEEALSAASEGARRASSEALAVAGDAGTAAADMAGGLVERGAAGLGSVYDYGRSSAHEMREGTDEAVRRAQDLGTRATAYLQEQPLLLGAIGVTLGAALGMLLPSSRYEREKLGEVREGLRDTAVETVRNMRDRAVRVAETVVDTAKDAMADAAASDPASSDKAAGRDTFGSNQVRGIAEEHGSKGDAGVKHEVSAQSHQTAPTPKH